MDVTEWVRYSSNVSSLTSGYFSIATIFVMPSVTGTHLTKKYKNALGAEMVRKPRLGVLAKMTKSVEGCVSSKRAQKLPTWKGRCRKASGCKCTGEAQSAI